MKIKKLNKHAQLPHKAHPGDLGYDLFSVGHTTIYPGEVALVHTGIAIQFPEGYGALIRDRSSVATKRNLFVVAGVIDNGYTGEIKIALYNSTNDIQHINDGEKIAQMILQPVVTFDIEDVDDISSLDGRGENGFGSTDNQPYPYDNYR
jgi:dUTP pyrophosphatase